MRLPSNFPCTTPPRFRRQSATSLATPSLLMERQHEAPKKCDQTAEPMPSLMADSKSDDIKGGGRIGRGTLQLEPFVRSKCPLRTLAVLATNLNLLVFLAVLPHSFRVFLVFQNLEKPRDVVGRKDARRGIFTDLLFDPTQGTT